MVEQRSLAKKYAIAFLNVYTDAFSLKDYQQLLSMLPTIKKHHQLLVLLSVPTLSPTEKKECLATFLTAMVAPTLLHKLAYLLLEQQRIELLTDVCQQLIYEYQKRNLLMPFTITSPVSLTHDQIDLLTTFLSKKTHTTITHTNTIDKKLIAGIRMQSDAFLWEYSIEQQLRMLKKNI